MGQVTVRVGGYSHPVSCEDGQEAHLVALAAEVDRRVSSVRTMGGSYGEPRLLLTRNYQDQYGDPGLPVRDDNAAGKPVMRFTADGRAVFVSGEGATKAGAFPFLATLPVAGGDLG